jgi:hypothetical protein
VTAVGIASAGPKRKVQIESEPPGATVYLNDVDLGAVCESTPCTIDAPIGSSTIILRLDKYEPEIRELDVPKGKRPLQQRYKLKGAIGMIRVDMPRGATLRINEEDKGKVPTSIEVAASEALHVVVVHNGKSVFDDIVEVATGDEYVVKPKGAADAEEDDTTIVTDDDGEGGGGGGGSGGGEGGSTGITGSTSTERGAYVTAAVAFDFGFRHFTYDQALTNNLREEIEGGQVMAGPAIELWPGRMAGIAPLRGLSLFGRFQFPISGQTVEGGDLMGTVKTKWSSFEASLRQRWVFGSFGVEVGGGFVEDRFTFDVTVRQDLNLMPDTRYQSVRLGGKLVFDAGNLEPYIAAENRLVLSGGAVGERFDEASASGLRGSIGVTLKLGAFSARLAGTLMHYTWQFSYDNMNDVAQAQGATDSIRLISAGLGYSY